MTAIQKTLPLLLLLSLSFAFGQTRPVLKSCFSPDGKYDDKCADKILSTLERIAVRKAFENALPFYDEVTIDFAVYAGDSLKVINSQSRYSEKLKKATILYLNQLSNSLKFPETDSIVYQWHFNTKEYTEPFRAMELQAHQRVAPLSFSQNDRGKLFVLKDNLPLQYRLVNYRIYRVLKENGINEIFLGSVNFKNGQPVYLEIELGFLTQSHTDMLI